MVADEIRKVRPNGAAAGVENGATVRREDGEAAELARPEGTGELLLRVAVGARLLVAGLQGEEQVQRQPATRGAGRGRELAAQLVLERAPRH